MIEQVITNFADLVIFFQDMSSSAGKSLYKKELIFHCFYCGSTDTTYDLEIEAGYENAELLVTCHECHKFKIFTFNIKRGVREV